MREHRVFVKVSCVLVCPGALVLLRFFPFYGFGFILITGLVFLLLWGGKRPIKLTDDEEMENAESETKQVGW